MRTPSIKTLSKVFENPKEAKRILQMSRSELLELVHVLQYANSAYNPRKTYDLRLFALNYIDNGLHGVESFQDRKGNYIDYLNTGDSYNDTLIYDGKYKVVCLGDYIEKYC